jgi:hypothetical protein
LYIWTTSKIIINLPRFSSAKIQEMHSMHTNLAEESIGRNATAVAFVICLEGACIPVCIVGVGH